MIQNKDGNIIITANWTKTQIKELLSFFGFIIICLFFPDYKPIPQIVGIIGTIFIIYVFYFGRDIIFAQFKISSNMQIVYTNTKDHRAFHFDEVSKCKFTEDSDLILYNDDEDKCSIIDMTSFDKTDIQVLLNILSEKFPILLDNSLIEEGFSAPQHKMSEATPARRRVVKEKNTEKTPLKPIANEVSKNNESTKNRRKLEL